MREWLDHLLGPDDRARFEAEGYLVRRDAVAPGTVARVRADADQQLAELRACPGASVHAVANLHDLVPRGGVYLDLLDLPTTFPTVFGILGWHIQCFHTQLVVTPPADPDAGTGPYAWHQDNNRMNRDFEVPGPHPRVSVKVAYFCTDLPEPGMGNLHVVPGSHLGPPVRPDDPEPSGAVALTARAGDAIVFDRRLWHAASVNHSDTTRVLLTYGYSYRWLRPKSAMAVDDLVERASPVRRQLLGWSTGANGYYDPQPADVPLRTWMCEHLGAGAVPA